MKRLCLSLLFGVLTALTLLAVPARPGVLRHTQADGTVVSYVIKGDEYGHYMMTTDGCAVSLDEVSGNLCYARYDATGRKFSTGVAVGASGSEAARAASRMIPVQRIRRAAARRRLTFPAADLSRPRTRVEEVPVSRAIVILAQFQDQSFRFPREQFVDLLTKEGYNFEDASGCALEYFNAQFRRERDFVFDVGPVVTLSRETAYYGEDDEDGNDLRAAQAAAEACLLSDPDVDFSRYDFIYVFYAGGNPADGGAADDHIWPHAWDFPSAGIRLRLDGKLLSQYAMSSELMNLGSPTLHFTGIGTFCHEFSHVLGLPDFYDVDDEKSGGRADAMWGTLSLMDSGNYNNDGRTPPNYTAVELEMLGLLEPEDLLAGLFSLDPMTTTRRALRLDTDREGEYYLFECRASVGWDRFIGGSGLLVYHLDKSDRDTGYSELSEQNLTAAQRWEYNEVNCRPDHQCADLIEALPRASSVSQVFYPYSTHTSLSGLSDPPFAFWSGDTSPYSLAGIRKASGVVSFTVNGPISLDGEDVFQEAAILNWHTDVESCKRLPSLVRCAGAGADTLEVSVMPYVSGQYSLTLEGLEPGRSYTVTICYVIDGKEEYPFVLHFTTSRYGGLPYIHMGSSARRNVEASMKNKIPLRVMNAKGATGVAWTLNGRSISVGKDGYYEIRSGGTLKAVVDYDDGTQDIIVREVQVK
ncbi:MAG: M6 family metalloprotease domain-containing protein [Bacteroidales bacterium]|nr:M6 family metalloprotease domain-containing protein [Bacteroidales bacterium]